jgi:signal transduction histidine kinase
MMKNKPLIIQFRLTFALIVFVSIAATVVTYALVVILYMSIQYKVIYPANYYEKQIPGIEEYIRQRNTALLMQSSQNSLEKFIPGNGISYQVIDGECNLLYGTIKERIIQNREQLYGRINTTAGWKGHYIRTVPIVENDGKISSAVLLSYQIKTSYVGNSANWWLTPLMIVILLSPFIYVTIFTLIFSKLFTNNINKPLQLLMEASRKIKGKDLDFEINYHSENELGRLCEAFSEMKEELKNSLSAQWKMEQERVEMVESLAHDLKTPLSIIQGYSEALIDSNIEGDEKLLRYLAIIKENSEKGSKLVQQMQYTSELEKSGVPLHLSIVDITSFIKRKVNHYELHAAEKKIKITTQIQDEVQKTISTDEEKLERILDNIVSNSLQYTPEGGNIQISIKMEPDNVFYEISDSGIGFSKKDIGNVFKKFYLGDEARRSTDGHSGLGLYVAKQMAEQLGGSIKVYNNKAGGACVAFRHKVFNRM